MNRSIYHELLGVPLPTAKKVKLLVDFDNGGYKYLLAVSTDSLFIVSPDREKIIETIVAGTDVVGYLCVADSENDFLDAITSIKSDILGGINPLNSIL